MIGARAELGQSQAALASAQANVERSRATVEDARQKLARAQRRQEPRVRRREAGGDFRDGRPAQAARRQRLLRARLLRPLSLVLVENVDSRENYYGVYLNATRASLVHKSKFITNYLAGPNTVCAGNNLFPVWSGKVSGTIKGDMKLTLHTVSAPRQIEVEVWPDIGSQACASNDVSEGSYPEPVAYAVADVPAGPGVTEIVMKNVNFKAASSLLVQLTPVGPGGPRILYDAADYATATLYNNQPAIGVAVFQLPGSNAIDTANAITVDDVTGLVDGLLAALTVLVLAAGCMKQEKHLVCEACIEKEGAIYCCAHCAQQAGVGGLRDRV